MGDKLTPNPSEFGAEPLEMTIDPNQFGALADVDEESGAPLRVRAAVGASVKPEDKLATLQTYYPDAKEWGDGNYRYTDQSTGNMTLFNPKGIDMGDVSENARMVFEFLGGAAGGTAAVVSGQLGPQIATPEELVTVPAAVGVGAAAGGQLFDAAANVFFPNVETRTIMEQTADMGIDVMANAVGQRLGEMAEVGIKTGIAKSGKVIGKASGDVFDAFKRSGVEPVAGAVSGNKTIQSIEQALSKLPISSDIIGNKASMVLDQISDFALKIANKASPVDGREMVGVSIKRGAKTFVTNFKDTANKLYGQLDEFIPAKQRVATPTFRQVLDDVSGQFKSDPAFAEILDSPLIKQLGNALAKSEKDGGMSYGTLKALRTKIGAAIDDFSLVNDTSKAELNRLYGALSDDMAISAANAGPEALKVFNRANTFWGAGRSRIDDVLQPVINKAYDHEIFQAAMSGSKHSAQKLRTLKKSLPVDDWNKIVGQQIREMGNATPGAQNAAGDLFSPSTFMTNYNKLSSEAKKIMFSGQGFKGLESAMDDLVTVSSSLKEVAGMANNSRTAEQLMYMNILTGGLGGAVGSQQEGGSAEGMVKGMAIGMVSPYAAAKLITNPAFVRWLAEGGKITKNQIASHLGRLAVIAEKNSGISPAIYEYMSVMQPQEEQ
jgi:hypothetical protein